MVLSADSEKVPTEFTAASSSDGNSIRPHGGYALAAGGSEAENLKTTSNGKYILYVIRVINETDAWDIY